VGEQVEKPGSKLHRKEAAEAVTLIETPPMIVVGVVGYVMTPRGLRTLNTVWAGESDPIMTPPAGVTRPGCSDARLTWIAPSQLYTDPSLSWSAHEVTLWLPCSRSAALITEHLSDDVKRRFYKNYFKSKKKAFTKYAAKYADGGKAIEAELEAMKKNATVVRVLAHTQIRKVANWGQKKPHVLEIQVRTWHCGGSCRGASCMRPAY